MLRTYSTGIWVRKPTDKKTEDSCPGSNLCENTMWAVMVTVQECEGDRSVTFQPIFLVLGSHAGLNIQMFSETNFLGGVKCLNCCTATLRLPDSKFLMLETIDITQLSHSERPSVWNAPSASRGSARYSDSRRNKKKVGKEVIHYSALGHRSDLVRL